MGPEIRHSHRAPSANRQRQVGWRRGFVVALVVVPSAGVIGLGFTSASSRKKNRSSSARDGVPTKRP
jgi:hypothetical protein